jgi:hypothetical protein
LDEEEPSVGSPEPIKEQLLVPSVRTAGRRILPLDLDADQVIGVGRKSYPTFSQVKLVALSQELIGRSQQCCGWRSKCHTRLLFLSD